jgi:hypothetical protein
MSRTLVRFGGDGANGLRIVAVRLGQPSRVIPQPPRARCGENRVRLPGARIRDESAEVLLKLSTGGRKYLLVVVRELNDHPISGLQRVNQLLPEALRDETSGASPVRRVVDNHRGVFEERRQELSPPVLGIWRFRRLVGHRGVAGQVEARSRLVLC